MEKTAEPAVKKFSFDDFKNHLQIVVEALAESDNVSIMLQRQGDEVLVFYKKRYSDKVNEIFEKAKREHQRRERAGYTREQAFEDLMKVQQEIGKYLRDDEIV